LFVTGFSTANKNQGEISQYLKEIQHRYQTFTSFLVSEKTRNYYHGDGILKQVRADEERDRWYFRVRDMQPDYEINIDPDQANKDALTIFINHRVFDYQGRLIGVTGVGLSVSAVKDIIELYQRKYRRTIYFFDKTRLIRPVHADARDQAVGLVPMMSVEELLTKLPEQGRVPSPASGMGISCTPISVTSRNSAGIWWSSNRSNILSEVFSPRLFSICCSVWW
jgi:hypothetical protein